MLFDGTIESDGAVVRSLRQRRFPLRDVNGSKPAAVCKRIVVPNGGFRFFELSKRRSFRRRQCRHDMAFLAPQRLPNLCPHANMFKRCLIKTFAQRNTLDTICGFRHGHLAFLVGAIVLRRTEPIGRTWERVGELTRAKNQDVRLCPAKSSAAHGLNSTRTFGQEQYRRVHFVHRSVPPDTKLELASRQRGSQSGEGAPLGEAASKTLGPRARAQRWPKRPRDHPKAQ